MHVNGQGSGKRERQRRGDVRERTGRRQRARQRRDYVRERTGKWNAGETTKGRRKGTNRKEKAGKTTEELCTERTGNDKAGQDNGGTMHGNGHGRGKGARQRRGDVRERPGMRKLGKTTEGLCMGPDREGESGQDSSHTLQKVNLEMSSTASFFVEMQYMCAQD